MLHKPEMQVRSSHHCGFVPSASRLACQKLVGSQFRARQSATLIRQNPCSSSHCSLAKDTKLPQGIAGAQHVTPDADTAHKLDGLPSDGTCIGVKLASAVMHSLYAAQDALDVLPQQPSYITDAPRLLIACLSHPDCSELRARLENQGVIIEEIKAVLQAHIGRSMRDLEGTEEQPDPCYSPLTKRIIRCAMQYAVRQGRDIVDLKDMLCTLTSNRDVISITSNPLYFALNYMFGPFEADKVMDSWCELLDSKATVSVEESDGILPPYISAGACELLSSAVEASTHPDSLVRVLQTYDHIGWAPSVTVSQAIWDTLLAWEDWESIDSTTAVQLLSALSSLAIPSSLRDKATCVAQLLITIFRSTEASFALTGDERWSSLAVAPLLHCMARFREAFTHAVYNKDEQDEQNVEEDEGDEIRGMQLVIDGKRVFHFRRRALYTVIKECIGNKSPEFYTVIKSILCLTTGARFDSMLPYHLRQHTSDSACFEAACFSAETRFSKLFTGSLVRTPVDALLNMPHYKSVKYALPASVWIDVLSANMHWHGHEILEDLHRQWGYIWEGADSTVLATRLRTLTIRTEANKHRLALSSPLISEWLWDDVLKLLPTASGLYEVRSILYDAKRTLNAPTPGTAARLSKVLQQVLRRAKPDDSVMRDYLMLTHQYVDWTASNHRSPRCNGSDAIPVVKVKDFDQNQRLSDAESSVPAAHMQLEDVHKHLAHMYLVSSSILFYHHPSKAMPLSKGNIFRNLTEARRRSLEEEQEMLCNWVFCSSQITTLEGMTWVCTDYRACLLKDEPEPGIDDWHAWAYTVAQLPYLKSRSRQVPGLAVMKRFLSILRQSLSLKLSDNQESRDAITDVVPRLTAFQQPGLWLGDSLRNAFVGGSGKYGNFRQMVWALSLSWSTIPPPNSLRLTDQQLSDLTDGLGAEEQDEAEDEQERVLMTAAAACQFSEYLSAQKDEAPFIYRQLLLATCKGLLSQINGKLQKEDALTHITKWGDEDLSMLCSLTQRLGSGVLPFAISKDEMTSALRVLVGELDRRMLNHVSIKLRWR